MKLDTTWVARMKAESARRKAPGYVAPTPPPKPLPEFYPRVPEGVGVGIFGRKYHGD